MKVIEYFTTENKEHWLSEIEKSDWAAGQYLATLLKENRLKDLVGQSALVPLLTEGEKLIAFCTFAPLDEVQPTQLSPWIGFLYTYPEYRGHRYAGMLLDWAESVATIMGREYIHISTNHEGLYEKYGYTFLQKEKDINGEETSVYRKALQEEGEEKENRMARGGAFKSEIVSLAKSGLDMVAYCGFSCNHCFLGQWCGGCRSVFNCCSFGTLSPDGKCKNATCCQEKGLDGCYDCPELEDCKKGFYSPDVKDASACRAQALFVRGHGKEAFFRALDRRPKEQESFAPTVQDELRILEDALQKED